MTKAAARLALATAGVAAAIYLTPASVHIVGWSTAAATRVAFVPPLLRLWIAAAIAIAIVAIGVVVARRRGISVDAAALRLAPLALLLTWLVPFLPWLPDRAPVLLIFAGPLRWAIAIAAVGAAAAPFVTRACSKWAALTVPRAAIFAVSLILYTAVGVQYAREMGFGGDEPHYLIITQSLLADRDLDIANNHERRDYRSFFPGELRPDFLRRGLHGEIYSIHAPGLPALLLPAYAAAGAVGAVVFIALLAALTALLVSDTAAIVSDRTTAALVWAATCLTIPFVPHAWLIYPELPGALIVAVGVRRMWRASTSAAGAFAFGILLATLPWLHTKFALLLAAFALFEAIRLWPRLESIAALLAPIAVSGAAWLYSFYRMYGVFDPEAPYGSYTQLFVLARNIPRGTLGLLFDQKFGLLMYSPVYLLAIAGAWLMLRDQRERWRAVGLIATAGAFFVSTTRLYMWWGGASAPARFLVPAVPLLAPLIAVAMARLHGAAGRGAIAATLVVSLAIAAVTIGSPGQELVYSAPHGLSALVASVQGSAPLDVSLPTFTEENWRGPISLLLPWLLAAAIAGAAAWLSIRRAWIGSPFWATAVGALTLVMVGAIGVGFRDVPDRAAIVTRGQLALMNAYDPSRLRAVDLTRMNRLANDRLLALAAIAIRRPADAPVDNPRVLEGPFELPQGRYDARVWFEAPRSVDGDAFVALSDQVVVARAAAPLANPTTIPFELIVQTPAFVGVTDAVAARSVRRVDIAPTFLVPRSARDPFSSHIVEPVEGAAGAYMAYLDDRTYPEGGVFWTRDTEKGSVAIVARGAPSIRLILHVGPNAGPVTIDTDRNSTTVDLKPDETREITVPASGTPRTVVSIRAAHAFRPSAVDPKSTDDRRLGCQVRPIVP